MSEPRTIHALAPCKVNLTLDVFAPRPDGFHDLDSVVFLFRPADELTITVTEGERGIRLTCSDPTLPTDERNLAYRAAQLLQGLYPEEYDGRRIDIALTKCVPHQAGLGGGSSDAAAVLRALARRADGPVQEAARNLGSDVPLFLHGDACRMSGRGEAITPLRQTGKTLPRLFGVIVKPAVGVPTGPAYRLLDELPGREPGNATPRLLDVLTRGGGGDAEAVGEAMGNDFEAAVLPAFPEVAEAHRAVAEAGAVRALLCGSGSAVFGLARARDHALALADALSGRFPFVTLAEPYDG